ncbi:MAG: sigma-70 family RNA polymerase sigma factor [Acidobacteria bacterium]|nr:MAG: sigma-70 family RNA polymerase sigma factor [Acidobacteriota bacterium]REJ99046.1 MAG: sigma-70 family RNA polymerase sigma factor [Acidobacteriota bacterium]REK16233.1 MAG: sigma-70 family RNA polymerase sigma factor [Acidobacteriota bacterium]REK43914.1 MAG: sigma-70 family RNA polymerase sigma factor [Acidobacteriota bacterium]
MTTASEKNEDQLHSRSLERDDAALVKACRRGDQSAWEELVDRYQRLVFAIPRRAGLPESEAADILQETFLTLFQKLDELEKPGKIRSWLVTTAKFKTWGVVRSEKGHHAPATEQEMELEMASLEDGSPLVEEALVTLEEQHLVRTALKKLEERCKTILSMIYLTEPSKTYAEVAEAIGVGATSISPLRARCLKKLEKILST